MSSRPLFIFDMANNHMGDVGHGQRIIRELRKVCSGEDFRFAVKLQYRSLPDLIHPGFRSRMDIKHIKRFTETALSWADCLRLRETIRDEGFVAICTPFDEASVDRVVEHGFDYLKVASCSLTDWPLAEKVASTSLPLIVSTAGEALEDIDRAVSFYQHRDKRLTVMHCVAEYPTATGRLELNQIDVLRKRYSGVEIGYSTHEAPGELDAIKMAIAKGATAFEKHVGVPTEKYRLNAYSATPEQISSWLAAARKAFVIDGKIGRRYEPSNDERVALAELRRGVFAATDIAPGEILATDNYNLALPLSAGQLSASDLSKYSQFTAVSAIKAGEGILASQVAMADTRNRVHEIIENVKALLKRSGAVVPSQLELEISHHHGIERFGEVGSAMITVINREYCKRLVLLLPGQWHPEHWHTSKDETFHILYGEIDMVLGGVKKRYITNDVVVIARGVRHEFQSVGGAVIEEISSTHTLDDSAYADKTITRDGQRKTFVTNWMD